MLDSESNAIPCATIPPREKSKDITDLKTETAEDCQRVNYHSADRLRHRAGGMATLGAFKQNHFTVTR
jgi:hypothetical protein